MVLGRRCREFSEKDGARRLGCRKTLKEMRAAAKWQLEKLQEVQERRQRRRRTVQREADTWKVKNTSQCECGGALRDP
jgi:hypothetical protein